MAQNNQLGQSLGQALGQFAFGGNSRQSEMKGMLEGAQAGSFDAKRQESLAQALKAQAEASQLQSDNERRTPQSILSNAMTGYGIPQDESQAVGQFMKTGTLGGQYAPSIDGMGPTAPAPAWAGKLADMGRSIQGVNTALTIGDKSSKSIAEAAATNNETDMLQQVSRGGDPQSVLRALLAAKGKGEFDNLGGNGVFSSIGGKQELNAVGTTAAQQNQAQAGASRASAANSYASAGQHNASRDKTLQEIKQGGKSGQTQIITDANGNVTLVDKVTGIARPAVFADGQTVGAKVASSTPKPLTEGQAKAVAFASRMENSISIVDKLAAGGVNKSVPGSRAGWGVGAAVNLVQPQERQQLDQAKRDFINANLRRESGAVISDGEFSNAELQYFPQVGDGPKVMEQKATNRRIALEGMKADIPANMGDATGNVIKKAGAPAGSAFGDAGKEQRYQEYKRSQGK